MFEGTSNLPERTGQGLDKLGASARLGRLGAGLLSRSHRLERDRVRRDPFGLFLAGGVRPRQLPGVYATPCKKIVGFAGMSVPTVTSQNRAKSGGPLRSGRTRPGPA